MITINDWIQIIVIAGALIGIYTKMVTKQKEQDMKIVALESKLASAERHDDRIMDKLDEITDGITELKIQLNNKQDRL